MMEFREVDRDGTAQFELNRFLPYLLNQSAEQVGKQLETVYRDRYNLSRTQWRILANLGANGTMTSAGVSRRAQTEKSKISRALVGLDERGLVTRSSASTDRRIELLQLTEAGEALFLQVSAVAREFDIALRTRLGSKESAMLEQILRKLVGGF